MTLWIDADVRASEEWGAVRDCGQKAASVLAEGAKQLKEAQAFLAGASPQLAADLGESCRFLGDLLAGIRPSDCDGGDDHRYSLLCAAQPLQERADVGLRRAPCSAEKGSTWGADLAEALGKCPEDGDAWSPAARTIAVGDDFKPPQRGRGPLQAAGGGMGVATGVKAA